MSINLIEYDPRAKTVRITEHCYIMTWLKDIIDHFPEEDHIKIFAYIYYMSDPSPLNPYTYIREFERPDKILKDIQPEFDFDDVLIVRAIEKCKEMYTTPVHRSYQAISTMMDNLNDYISNTQISDGKDGNITAMFNIAKNFKQLKDSFESILKDALEETKIKSRGVSKVSYDQRKK